MDTDDIARSTLQRLEDAWNAGDGTAYGREFTDEARFVNIHGALVAGRPAIAAGHDQILSTGYAGSVNRMRLVSAERVSDDVVVATSRHTLAAPRGPLAGTHDAVVTSVLVRSADAWRIAAAQTTLVNPAMTTAGAR